MPKLCEFQNCKKRALYGTIENKNKFCLQHKNENMINFNGKCV